MSEQEGSGTDGRRAALNGVGSMDRLVKVGYAVALMPLVAVPLVFAPLGAILGMVNIRRSHSGHGLAQILLALLLGYLGSPLTGVLPRQAMLAAGWTVSDQAQPQPQAQAPAPPRPTAVPAKQRVGPYTQEMSKGVNYVQVDPRLLMSDNATYVHNTRVQIHGRVLTVNHMSDFTWAQLMAEVDDKPYTTQSIAVYIAPKDTRFLTDERMRVSGEIAGLEEQTLQLTGAKVKVPVLVAHFAEPDPAKK